MTELKAPAQEQLEKLIRLFELNEESIKTHGVRIVSTNQAIMDVLGGDNPQQWVQGNNRNRSIEKLQKIAAQQGVILTDSEIRKMQRAFVPKPIGED